MIKRTLMLVTAGVVCMAVNSASAISFTATGTGPITAYFYGESAGYGSQIGLWVNGTFQGTYGLQNHLSALGQPFVLGNANAGDSLVFELQVSTSGYYGPPPYSYSVWSNPSLNADLAEHTTASPFAGGPYSIPAGTLVGFEDIMPITQSDYDFNDHLFVFTGVKSSSVPDACSTLGLLGCVTALLGAVSRRFRK